MKTTKKGGEKPKKTWDEEIKNVLKDRKTKWTSKRRIADDRSQ